MDKLTSTQWSSKAAQISGSANNAHKQIGTAPSVIWRSAQRNDGYVEKKFCYMLSGLELEQDPFLQRCKKHRDNPALVALLDELDKMEALRTHQSQKKT